MYGVVLSTPLLHIMPREPSLAAGLPFFATGISADVMLENTRNIPHLSMYNTSARMNNAQRFHAQLGQGHIHLFAWPHAGHRPLRR
jgi:hypothetical protein